MWRQRFCCFIKLPLWLLLLFTVVCVPGLMVVFYFHLEQSPVAYFVYSLSAYGLVLWIVRSIGVAKQVKIAVYAHPWGHRYMTDVLLRGRISLHIAIVVHWGYGLFKLGTGIYYDSFWFGAMGVYYLILTGIRALLLRSIYEKTAGFYGEFRASRLCGYLLLVLNIALSLLIVQMVAGGKGNTYPRYIIFVVALYTFYAVISSVVSLIRFPKGNSPALTASKVVGFAGGLVSMLLLQTAMFASFGGGAQFQRRMNAATGGVVCILIFLMASLMIGRANKAIGNHGEIGQEGGV